MAKKKKSASYPKPSIKNDGYAMHYGTEIQDMMEQCMYKGAGRRHPSEDLNNGCTKPPDERFDIFAKKDSIRAFHRAGLDARSGANNNAESLDYSRKIGLKTKKRK